MEAPSYYTDTIPTYEEVRYSKPPSYTERQRSTINVNNVVNIQPPKKKKYKGGGARGGLARSIPITVPTSEPPSGAIKSLILSLGAREAPPTKRKNTLRAMPLSFQNRQTTQT